MQARVHRDEAKTGPSVRVGNPVEALLDAAGDNGQKTASNRSIAHIDQEKVDQRLRRSDHVFLRSNELDHAVVQIGAERAVSRPLVCGIPIESLGDIVGEVTHVATPAVAMVEEGNEGIDIGTAASAS